MRENTFFQTTKNIEKAGAYYTDLSHCEKLGKMFKWPDEEVCVIEPSVGDAKAVKKVTNGCKERRIFAVELQKDVAIKLRNDDEIFEVLQADFLTTKISNGAFSFCFANPPYIENEESRMEIEFLKRLSSYIANEGVIVYIVPIITATNKAFLKTYLSRFRPLYEFRFDEDEYKKYKQIVFIGRKTKNIVLNQEILDEYEHRTKEDYGFIPNEWNKEKIEVFSSYEKNISFFTSYVFNAEKAYEDLVKINPQKSNLKKLSIGDFNEYEELGRPPVMPNKNTLYLLSTLGCGSGLTGTKEGKDIHLQRGQAKTIKRTYDDIDENGNVEEVTQTSTQVSVTVIQDNGEITVLE